jgi:transposase
MVRLAATCLAASILGFKDSFNEDDLYANGEWIVAHQSKIEERLWKASSSKSGDPDGLFFYDVTSSYFEGTENELAEFGYNRDKVKGKKQVVMGLLTDSQGEPISVQLFPGNTNDLGTFDCQIQKLKHTFAQKDITMVGDRGMIRGPQQQKLNAEGFHYISALHKCEIETLLKNEELNMDLFAITVQETLLEDGRRLVTRCNPVRRDEISATRQQFRLALEAWLAKTNIYLKEHPKAKAATHLKHAIARLSKGKLNAWMQVVAEDRVLRLIAEEEKLKEHAKLDGCYAIVSDLPVSAASSEQLHDRYKDLAKVESDFRTLKHGHLEIRPWYVRTEENTRAHALTAMLALKIRRELEKAWRPLNTTVEEGLAELGRICVMEIYDKASGATISRVLPTPSDVQATLLAAISVELPKNAPPKGPVVGTRVKLEERRKKNATL